MQSRRGDLSKNFDDFLNEFKKNTKLNYPVINMPTLVTVETVKYKLKEKQFIVKVPQLSFEVTKNITEGIRNDILRKKQTINGIIMSYDMNQPLSIYQKINVKHDSDISSLQQSEESFCVGYSILKQSQGYNELTKRITEEVMRCMERKMNAIYQKNSQKEEYFRTLDEIDKLLIRNFRVFLVFELKGREIVANKFIFYPNSKFLLKQITITPSKYLKNLITQSIFQNSSHFDSTKYGYLSFAVPSKQSKELKLLLLDKDDPSVYNQQVLIGIWISMKKLNDKSEKQKVIWSVIMEYLRNPLIKRRISINTLKTGLLILYEQIPGKKTKKILNYQYLFEIMEPLKWQHQCETEYTSQISQKYRFKFQETIIYEEEKEQSEVQSISLNKETIKQARQAPILHCYDGGRSEAAEMMRNSKISTRSIDQKDHQIMKLKMEVQMLKQQNAFYKHNYQQLSKNMTMMNPMMQHHYMPQMIPIHSPPIYYPSQQTQAAVQNNQIPKQVEKEVTDYGHFKKSQSDKEPEQTKQVNKFNKKKSCEEPYDSKESSPKVTFPAKMKKNQFKNVDYRNISFAQQNSIDEGETQGFVIKNGDIQEHVNYNSPQFKVRKEENQQDSADSKSKQKRIISPKEVKKFQTMTMTYQQECEKPRSSNRGPVIIQTKQKQPYKSKYSYQDNKYSSKVQKGSLEDSESRNSQKFIAKYQRYQTQTYSRKQQTSPALKIKNMDSKESSGKKKEKLKQQQPYQNNNQNNMNFQHSFGERKPIVPKTKQKSPEKQIKRSVIDSDDQDDQISRIGIKYLNKI